MADVFVSWVELQVAPAAVIRSASASQTVGSFTQVATAQRITSAQTEVAWVALQMPSTALASREITGTQTVGSFTQSASLSDIIGQINGGGTITSDLPHRSIGATQTVGTFQQSAAGGGAGVLGPILASATQQVANFGQVAVADAQRTITAAQTIQPFGQSAYIGDRPQPVVDTTVSGGYGNPSRRYSSRVKGRMVYAATYAELARKVLEAKAEDAPKRPRVARASVVESPPPDPVETVRSEMQTQLATLQRQMAELAQQRVRDAQAIAQTYEARLATAESGTRAALALAQKAQRDMQALAALLTE